MVENAYKVTLVAAFVPLAFGLYWKRANTQGALFAMAWGLSTWILLEILKPDTVWPPQLVGLLMSIAGMVVGSLLPNFVGRPTPHAHLHAELHHQAAAQTRARRRKPPHHHPSAHGE